jgi:tartrate-resistant acid phosphatase type 5
MFSGAAMANRSAAVAGKVLIAVLAVATLLCAQASTMLPRLEHASPKNDGSLSIVVVGDWGRMGMYNQSRVAEQVTRQPCYHLDLVDTICYFDFLFIAVVE